MANANFDLPVTNNSYTGSDRAKSAMKAATGPASKPVAFQGPPATQSDMPVKTASTNDNLTRTKQTVLNPMTKPAMGATPPTNVDAMQRPQGTKPMKGKF